VSKQPPQTGDRQFRNDVVRIAELTVNTSTIEGYEFSNCRVIGPAILAFLGGVTVSHCTWDAPGLDAIFWEVPRTREFVVGIVGVVDCTFSNCHFELIGIAGPPEMRSQLEEGFKAAP
jgi:hypothetical protein